MTSFDIDPFALATAQENAEEMEAEAIPRCGALTVAQVGEIVDFVECDVETVAPARRHPMADTVHTTGRRTVSHCSHCR